MRVISKKKIETFQKKLTEKNIDVALFLTSEPIYDINIEYFTGFEQTRFFSFSCLLVKKGKITLVVSPLSYDQAIEETEADEIINLGDYDRSLSKILKEKLKGCKNIGIIENIFPYKLYNKFRKLKFTDISDIILELRSTKEPKEIDRIKKSCKIVDHGIKIIEDNFSKKITEKELALILEQNLIKKGADESSFPTIVSSGNRSAFVHPYPSFSNEKIKEGLGIVDFGVIYKGYCSDITVPFTLGKISEKQKKIIEVVEEAYEKVIDMISLNVPTWIVHKKAEDIIKRNGFKFKHSLGHGLGLELHDMPYISPKPIDKEELKNWKEFKLKENMIFTIEPGVYEPGVGGCRLENDVLLEKKPKVLTHSRLLKF